MKIISKDNATLVTPSIAQELLRNNYRNQRKIDKKKVSIYKRDMLNGKWSYTAEPIKVDQDMNLIDGQNRLTALIQANVNLPFLITESPTNSFYNIDTGKTRTPQDLFDIKKISNGKDKIKIINVIQKFNYSVWPNSGGVKILQTNQDILEFYEKNKSDINYILQKSSGRSQFLGPEAVYYILAGYINTTDFNEVWEILENIKKQEPTTYNQEKFISYLKNLKNKALKMNMKVRSTDYVPHLAHVITSSLLGKKWTKKIDKTPKEIIPNFNYWRTKLKQLG